MLKINRTTEYGLMALRHMSRKADAAEVTSAREVSDSYGIPFEITAKTLQRLKDTGLIQSAQGARGGYTLLKPLDQVSLAEFLRLMEGPQSVVLCSHVQAPRGASPQPDGNCGCEYNERCEIKDGMSNLNRRLLRMFSEIRLTEILEGRVLESQFLTAAPAGAGGGEP
jgi:Rrf2 family protein